jgi:pimeloyl-ACP methyl ester carboxylesterase
VNVPEAELTELRQRIKVTRWPERETVADQSQGVQLATVQKLACYWATEYNWRKIEAKLIQFNRLDKGGHFAAWEQPELFVAELRAAFKSLR